MFKVEGIDDEGAEMESKKVSNNMLTRMPAYLNYLKSLPQSTKNISATKIANALALGEVLVRKDLAKISDGGRCKLGYVCEELIQDIEKFLDVKSLIDAIIVGKGELVQILLNYNGLTDSGVNVLAGFDMDCSKKRRSEEKNIYPIDKIQSFCAEHRIEMGILMVPAEYAQEACEQLVLAGVKAIWNFTPVYLNVPKEVVVQNENIITSIIKLRMQLKERNEIS